MKEKGFLIKLDKLMMKTEAAHTVLKQTAHEVRALRGQAQTIIDKANKEVDPINKQIQEMEKQRVEVMDEYETMRHELVMLNSKYLGMVKDIL